MFVNNKKRLFSVITYYPSWTLNTTTAEWDSNPSYIVFQPIALPLSYERYYMVILVFN
ncbi:Uncharacterized protein APZ42_006592, partial [Daphnia magna]